MAKPKDITGQRFGKLIAIERTGRKQHGTYFWKCKCDCGNFTEATVSNLLSGNVKSCGCLRKPPIMTIHGGSKHGAREKLYNIWVAMKQRCYNENDANYERYGGRGISVCDEWKDDYVAFRSWCYTHGYQQGLELDRENNDKGYSPDNCRFVTHRDNLLNTHRAKKYRRAETTC